MNPLRTVFLLKWTGRIEMREEGLNKLPRQSKWTKSEPRSSRNWFPAMVTTYIQNIIHSKNRYFSISTQRSRITSNTKWMFYLLQARISIWYQKNRMTSRKMKAHRLYQDWTLCPTMDKETDNRNKCLWKYGIGTHSSRVRSISYNTTNWMWRIRSQTHPMTSTKQPFCSQLFQVWACTKKMFHRVPQRASNTGNKGRVEDICMSQWYSSCKIQKFSSLVR